jgi:hypothetical protein
MERTETKNSPRINNQLLVFTVGTEWTTGLINLKNTLQKFEFNYEILGTDQQWNGGDITQNPGGGQKINIVKERLLKGDINDDTILLFVDGYDVIMLSYSLEILDKYLNKFNNKIVFAAEKTIWPNPDLAEKFLPSPTPYKFLNSGCYIGRVKQIKRLLNFVNNSDDDQEYFQKKYLTFEHPIVLDYYSSIFQCLESSSIDLQIKLDKNRIYNCITDEEPCCLHGNGGKNTKELFYHISHILLGT